MASSKSPVDKRPDEVFTNTGRLITPELRRKLIAEKAFQLAEQRGFTGDCQLHDWLEAEAKIDRIYGKAEQTD